MSYWPVVAKIHAHFVGPIDCLSYWSIYFEVPAAVFLWHLLRRLCHPRTHVHPQLQYHSPLTVCLKSSLSSRVSVSALAMTGTMLTTLLRRLMNSTSRGLRLRRRRWQLEMNESDFMCLSFEVWRYFVCCFVLFFFSYKILLAQNLCCRKL